MWLVRQYVEFIIAQPGGPAKPLSMAWVLDTQHLRFNDAAKA